MKTRTVRSDSKKKPFQDGGVYRPFGKNPDDRTSQLALAPSILVDIVTQARLVFAVLIRARSVRCEVVFSPGCHAHAPREHDFAKHADAMRGPGTQRKIGSCFFA